MQKPWVFACFQPKCLNPRKIIQTFSDFSLVIVFTSWFKYSTRRYLDKILADSSVVFEKLKVVDNKFIDVLAKFGANKGATMTETEMKNTSKDIESYHNLNIEMRTKLNAMTNLLATISSSRVKKERKQEATQKKEAKPKEEEAKPKKTKPQPPAKRRRGKLPPPSSEEKEE